jgi:hypothetical protein
MKKTLVWGCFFGIVLAGVSAHDLKQAVQNGNIQYIQKFIAEYDHWSSGSSPYEYLNLTRSDCRLFRNTIYALHGYRFKAKDLQEHFNRFDWYKGTKDDVENEFSERELRQIAIVLRIEANYPASIPEGLAGHWVNPVQASVEEMGWLHVWINPNGIMIVEGNYYLWSLKGAHFRTGRIEQQDESKSYVWWMGDGENQNFAIQTGDSQGRQYKWCDFFSSDVWFQADNNPYEIFYPDNPFK